MIKKEKGIQRKNGRTNANTQNVNKNNLINF